MRRLALRRRECRIVVRSVSGVGRPLLWISSQVASNVLRRSPCNGELVSRLLSDCALALLKWFCQRERPDAQYDRTGKTTLYELRVVSEQDHRRCIVDR